MTELSATLHTWIDAEAAKMHRTLDEILNRQARQPVTTKARICVDPGHGGEDPGATIGTVREAELVMGYAEELVGALRQRGHQVLVTREANTFVPLSSRAQASNQFHADLFLSIHANFAGDDRAEGAWIIHSAGSRLGEDLARRLFRELAKVPGIVDGDPEEEVFPDGSPWVGGRTLAVLRKTFAPAVIIELGFLSSPDDLARLQNPVTRLEVCWALADGCEAWLKDRYAS